MQNKEYYSLVDSYQNKSQKKIFKNGCAVQLNDKL